MTCQIVSIKGPKWREWSCCVNRMVQPSFFMCLGWFGAVFILIFPFTVQAERLEVVGKVVEVDGLGVKIKLARKDAFPVLGDSVVISSVSESTEPKDLSSVLTVLIGRLRSSDPKVMQRAAKEIYTSNYARHPAILETVHSKLIKGYKLIPRDSHHIDGMAWLCRVLGHSGNAGYANSLKIISNKSPSKKIRKYALLSLKMIGKGIPEKISDSPSIKIHSIAARPFSIQAGTAFDLEVTYTVRDPSADAQRIPAQLNISILSGAKVLGEKEVIISDSCNGVPTKRVQALKASKRKGAYAIRVTLKYKEVIAEDSTKLIII